MGRDANITVFGDGDGDGLPDDWETQYGLNPANALDAALDKDGDGMSNSQEYIAGTDPGNSASYLEVEQLTADAGGAAISFVSQANKTYTLQYKDAIAADWQRLADITASTYGRITTVTDPSPLTNRFYRLVTPRMP